MTFLSVSNQGARHDEDIGCFCVLQPLDLLNALDRELGKRFIVMSEIVAKPIHFLCLISEVNNSFHCLAMYINKVNVSNMKTQNNFRFFL